MAVRTKNLSKRGFTLIELIIIIAIVGILAMIMVPVFMNTLPRYYARAEARELMFQFKKAKLEAVKRNRDVCIDFINVGTANSQYRIFVNVDRDTNTPHTYDPGAGDVLIADQQLQKNVQFVSTTFTNSQAGFNNRGLPLQLANQNIVLGAGTAGSRSYTLIVSQTGNVRIQ